MNGKEQEGFGMYDVTIHKGERASVSKFYLNQPKKKNLKFLQRLLSKGLFLMEKRLLVLK